MRIVIKYIFIGKVLDFDDEYKSIQDIISDLDENIFEGLGIDGIDVAFLKEKGYDKSRKIIEKYYYNIIKFMYGDEVELKPTYEILKSYKDLAIDYYLDKLGVTA